MRKSHRAEVLVMLRDFIWSSPNKTHLEEAFGWIDKKFRESFEKI
jgi:hypothetical protein